MKIIASKGRGCVSLEIPSDFCEKNGISDSSQYELFPLKDGFFLLARQGALAGATAAGDAQAAMAGAGAASSSAQPQKSNIATDAELSLLRRLSQIKFQERTPELVERQLSEEEKRTLRSLVQKKLIFAFYGGKYAKGGVYNIPDSVYPMLSGKQAAAGANSAAAGANAASLGAAASQDQAGGQAAQSAKPTSQLPPINTFEHFEQAGYCIVQKEHEIKMMHERLKEKISSGEAIGVRAFDKKLYAARKRFFSSAEEKIRPHLDSKGKSIEQVAKAANLAEDAALVALVILCDSGEAIEKRKGFYSIA